MRELLDRISLSLTGVRASEMQEEDGEIGRHGLGDLSDCRVVIGFDRIRKTIPGPFYPLIVFDIGNETATIESGWNRLRTVTITAEIAVRVPGKLGALFGYTGAGRGVLDIQESLLAALLADQQLRVGGKAYASGIRGYQINPQVGIEDGVWIGKRYSALEITYQVPTVVTA
jgi:hypothetical protein